MGEYRGILEARALQLNIDNNLDFAVALYPYELVTYGETGQVFQNWMQYRLVKQYLERMTEEQTLVVASGHPVGLFPSAPRRAAGDQHQRAHGGRVRQPRRLPRGGPAGRGQLRADDRRRLDVHRAAGHRARDVSDAAERGAAVSGVGAGRRTWPECCM